MPEKLSIRDLQTQLTEAKATWTINPAFLNRETVPQFPLGAEPKELRKAIDVARIDLKAIMLETPNPLVVARRAEMDLTASAVAPVAGLPAAGYASSVDWRNRWGWPWLVSIQDQGSCQSCWVFGAVALIDAMVRIEHAFWTKRSEGDVHRGMGAMCATTGNPENALNWIRDHGVADLDCYPYVPNSPMNKPYAPSSDRGGRTVKVGSYVGIGNVNDQKKWLDAVGPLTACFAVYGDFFGVGSGVYHHVTGTLQGYHCILVVGYDDAHGCWICKNQWGSGFGDHGYFRIRYGDSDIDTWEKCGIQGTNPDPWTKRRLHSGAMIESGNGATHRNFELTAMEGHALRHWFRDGTSLAWGKASLFAGDVAEQPTLTSTTYNRNFELVCATTGGRLHH